MPSGGVQIDLSGKANGRGAYICRTSSCWDIALKKNRLEQALRTKLTTEDRQALLEFSLTLLSEQAT